MKNFVAIEEVYAREVLDSRGNPTVEAEVVLEDGKEYVITNPNTPTPWFNVLANKKFGTLVSNNMTGFTYAYNSQQYKISSWTNDIIMQDQSEGIQINEERFVPEISRFGFGYSTYSTKTKNLEEELTVFVAKEDTAKLYLLKLKII